MKINETIKKIRKSKGFNQYILADATGVSVDTVRRWEKGTQVPRADELVRLANALNVTEAELLNGTVKQEFEVKILMGVKILPNVAGLEIKDDSFFYGVDDEKPQIHIGGRINIATAEDREKALKKIIENFQKACWMFDHKKEAEAQISDCGAILTA